MQSDPTQMLEPFHLVALRGDGFIHGRQRDQLE